MIEEKIKYESFDGLILEGTYTRHEEHCKGFILQVHGMTADREEWGFYRGLSNFLAGQGFSSYRIDFRCHGIDSTPFEELTIFGVINDIVSAYNKMTELANSVGTNLPKYLMGCSFSGGICALCAKSHNLDIEKIFLCYPVIDYIEDLIKTAGNWKKSLKEKGFIEYADKPIARPLVNELPYINSIRAVTNPSCQITILHGENDSDVPISLSKKFCTSDKCKLIPIVGAEHGFGIPGDFDLVDPKSLKNFQIVYDHVLEEL